MSTSGERHQVEIQGNRRAWENKPLLREIYRGFYKLIAAETKPGLPGRILEIGSGIGNLKSEFPEAICSDLFPNPWLDLVCDGYELPFQQGALSHIVLFDVFHHLKAPIAFFREASRVICPGGRIIIFDPYISLVSRVAYGLFHHEPIGWSSPIDRAEIPPLVRDYYAAQGNLTRLFFREKWLHSNWSVHRRKQITSFAYLLSGGFSKPSLYPSAALPLVRAADSLVSVAPGLFAARALVVLERT